ncbi:MAG: STM3941 family protein [bacterium]
MNTNFIKQSADHVVLYSKPISIWMLLFGFVMFFFPLLALFMMIVLKESWGKCLLVGLAMLFFGAAFFYILYRYFGSRKELVTLDKDGISFVNRGKFFWNDIDEICCVTLRTKYHTTKMIQFFSSHFDEHFHRLPFWTRVGRFLNSIFNENKRICAAEIMLQDLPCSKEEFFELIRSYSNVKIVE